MDPDLTYEKLRERTRLEMCTKTIYRILKDYGLTNWLAKKRPRLTPEVAAKQLQWAIEHKDWSYEEWSKIIWLDECSVKQGTGKRRRWVW